MPIISGSINVHEIDKERLFIGKKGTYLDIVLIPIKENQYGDDYMIAQSVTKEERLQGMKGNILGNAKIFELPDGERRAPQPPAGYPPSGAQDSAPAQEFKADDDVPF